MNTFSVLPFSLYIMMHGRLCDEATSALDSSTEGEILTSLRSLANDRTAIFIAHRLTTAMQCDEVSVAPVVKIMSDVERECFGCGLLYGSRCLFLVRLVTGHCYALDMIFNFPDCFA